MKKEILITLLVGALFCTVQAQYLNRQTDGKLSIELMDLKNRNLNCPIDEKVTIDLFKKTHNDNELTCSKRNSWDKVETIVSDRVKRIQLPNMGKGIYKAELSFAYQCKDQVQSNRKITQIFESNIFNDFDRYPAMEVAAMANDLDLIVFPNPSHDRFIISISESQKSGMEDYELTVFSGDGQLVLRKEIQYQQRSQYEIDLSHFASGQYTITVSQAGKMIGTSKVFKISKR